MTTTMPISAADLPLEIKTRLLGIARRLPESSRGEFLRNASRRIAELAMEHPRTIFFAVAGCILGHVLGNLLTFGVPMTETVVSLTADSASEVGGIVGALYGFVQDKKQRDSVQRIVWIIQEELQTAALEVRK